MTIFHPDIKKLIAEWQDKLREITGNDAVILECHEPPSFSMEFDELARMICGVTGVPLEKVRSKSRKREIVVTRQLICYCCREYTNMTLKKIGKAIGGKHHSTVIHCRDQVMEYLQSGDSFICKAMAGINERLPDIAHKCEVPDAGQEKIDEPKERVIGKRGDEHIVKKKIDKETRKYYHTGRLHI